MTQKELREQNRAAVIRAAQGRFLAQSIDKTTIAEIAEDADLTPPPITCSTPTSPSTVRAARPPGAVRRKTVMRRFPAYWAHISIPTRPIRNTSAFCRTWRSTPCASS